MSAKILKAFSAALWIVSLEVIVSSCAMNLSPSQDSTNLGTDSTQGTTTTADTSHPSGQPTSEGHGTGDFATLLIQGTLSPEEATRLADSHVVKTFFTVSVQNGPEPLMDGEWTSMGEWSSPDLSIKFTNAPRSPPPHIRDYCIDPFLQLSAFYGVKTEREGVDHYDYYVSPQVLQACPGDVDLFRLNLPLNLQCHDCGAPKSGKLIVQGVLSEEDTAQLANSTGSTAAFSIQVEGGTDPSSESDWTLVGIWGSNGLSITFSDIFGSLPPNLSDICLFPYVRITAAYKLGIETEGGIQPQYYKSPPIVQACPTEWDVAEVTLPLNQCQDCVTKTPLGLTANGVLSVKDLKRLAHASILDPLFSVMVEAGPDPTSDTDWLPMGEWDDSSRSITFSSFLDDPSPYLSDICHDSYVRLTGTLKMQVEMDGVIHSEFYQSRPVIQACPGLLDSDLVRLPLMLQARGFQ